MPSNPKVIAVADGMATRIITNGSRFRPSALLVLLQQRLQRRRVACRDGGMSGAGVSKGAIDNPPGVGEGFNTPINVGQTLFGPVDVPQGAIAMG
jgi:hypothetical protein